MLPALGGLYAVWLAPVADRAGLALAARAWVGGAVALPAALFVVAWRPAWKAVVAAPAVVTTLAAAAFAVVGLT